MSNHEDAYRRLFDDYISGKGTLSRLPKAFLIAGPPGSGKSRLANEALQVCISTNGQPVQIDSDRFRQYVPGYGALAITDPAEAFSLSQQLVSQWSDRLRKEAIEAKLDIVCEGLFKTVKNNEELLNVLKDHQYEVEVVAKVITPALSLLQTELRYERQLAGLHGRETTPRRVPAVAHNDGYAALPHFVELAVASGVSVSLRDIYNAPLLSVEGSSPSEQLEQLRTSVPPQTEQLAATQLLVLVQEFRANRNAPKPPESGSALESAINLMASWP